VLYRETRALLDELADATLDGTRKEHVEFLVTVPLLILDDLGMRKMPLTAAEELLEIISDEDNGRIGTPCLSESANDT
jgi:DNA replication protein DnaC